MPTSVSVIFQNIMLLMNTLFLVFCVFVFQIGSHIKKQVGELGFTCTGLVTKAGALQCSPNDTFTKKELIESARKVSEKVRSKNVFFSQCFREFVGLKS